MAGRTYTTTLTLPDGRRKYFRGKTKEEAEKKKEEAKMLLGMGVSIGDTTTVTELSNLWFRLYKEGHLHKRSEETITNTLTRYILPILGRMKVVDVKPIHIQQLMDSVKTYSKSTQKKVLQNTRALFDVAVENGIVLRSPVSKSIKAGGADPAEKTPLTKAQAEALIEAVTGTRAHPLVLLLYYGGLRIGEALGLQWSDIDFEEGTVTVNRSLVFPEENRQGVVNPELKTARSHRTVPLPWPVIDKLKYDMSKSNSVWVFAKQNGQHHSYGSFRALWELVDRRCDPTGKVDQRDSATPKLPFSVHPHLLRHSCITRWFESGLDIKEIQYLAGHSTVDITLNVYTHYLNNERRHQTAEKIRAAV